MVSNQVKCANYIAKKYRYTSWSHESGPSIWNIPTYEKNCKLPNITGNVPYILICLLLTNSTSILANCRTGCLSCCLDSQSAGLAALNMQSTSARATRAQNTHIENEDINDAVRIHVEDTLPVGNAAGATRLAAGDPPEPVLPHLLYDDGTMVDESGEVINDAPEHADTNPAATDTTVVAESHAARPVPTTDDSSLPPATERVSPAAPSLAGVESQIERDFVSSFSAESNEAPADPFTKSERSRSRAATAAAIAAITLATAAMAVNTLRRGGGKSLLVLAGLATASSISMPGTTHTVHSSDFALSGAHFGTTGDGCREHGLVDSGTTENTSGRAKLFPSAMVEEWHPKVKVEVASGVCLPVRLRGVMLIKVESTALTTSTKKFRKVPLKHSGSFTAR